MTYEGSALPVSLTLHRIATARVLERPSVTPPSFNLKTFLDKGALGFRLSKTKVRVVFLIEPKAGAFLRETPIPGDQTICKAIDGRLRVEVEHFDTHQLRNFLWSFGPAVEILEPVKMRNVFREGVEAMAKRYATPSAADEAPPASSRRR